jgi:hypothetical protein
MLQSESYITTRCKIARSAYHRSIQLKCWRLTAVIADNPFTSVANPHTDNTEAPGSLYRVIQTLSGQRDTWLIPTESKCRPFTHHKDQLRVLFTNQAMFRHGRRSLNPKVMRSRIRQLHVFHRSLAKLTFPTCSRLTYAELEIPN